MYSATRGSLLIKRIENPKTTSSGIILKSSDEAEFAKVLSIGSDITDVNVGDFVLVNWNKTKHLKKLVYYVKLEDVVAVKEGENEEVTLEDFEQ